MEARDEAKPEDFDYLLSMTMWTLTLERKEELLKKKQEKHAELDRLRATKKEDLWRADLKELMTNLDEFERKQEEQQKAMPIKKSQKGERKKQKITSSPLKQGIRIVPTISGELKKKAFAANEKKEKKNAKDAFGKSLKDKMAEFDEPDEFDDMADDKEHNRSLSDRLGFTLKAEEKPKKPKGKRNSSEKQKVAKKKKKTGGNPWEDGSHSDSNLSNSDFNNSDSDTGYFNQNSQPLAVDRPGRERKTVSYKFGEDSDSNESLENSTEDIKPTNGHANKYVKSSESEDEKSNKDNGSDNAFDSLIEKYTSSPKKESKPQTNGTSSGVLKNGSNPYGSDSDDYSTKKNGEKAALPKAPSTKSNQFQFSDSDSGDDVIGKSSSEDEFLPSKKKEVPKKIPAATTKKKLLPKKTEKLVSNLSFRTSLLFFFINDFN